MFCGEAWHTILRCFLFLRIVPTIVFLFPRSCAATDALVKNNEFPKFLWFLPFPNMGIHLWYIWFWYQKILQNLISHILCKHTPRFGSVKFFFIDSFTCHRLASNLAILDKFMPYYDHIWRQIYLFVITGFVGFFFCQIW